MKQVAMILGALATIAPAVASAGPLDLQVGPNFGAGVVDAAVAPGSGEHFLDLTFIETGPNEDEGLFAYEVLIRAPQPLITLQRAEKPDHWVLDDPNATFSITEAAADHILLRGMNSDTGRLHDITTGDKAARVYYSVDPGASPGLYNLTLDPEDTVIGSGHPGGALPPLVGVVDPGVVLVTPEPTALGLLWVAGILALRRPTRACRAKKCLWIGHKRWGTR